MLQIEDHDGIRLLALDRPEALNAFNGPLYDALTDAIIDAGQADDVVLVCLTSRGRVFSAGADLAEMGGGSDYTPRHGFNGLVHTLLDFDKPFAVAVNGAAVGVGSTVCGLADFVFMAEGARMRCPFASLGINPEAGSSLLFPMMMGMQRAAWYLMSADFLDAKTCVEWGLALRSFPDAGFHDAVLAELARVAKNAPSSLRETKQLLRHAHRASILAVIAAENEALGRTVRSPENIEAISAFMEKRSPDFARLRQHGD